MKSLFYKPIKIKHPDEDILFWGCIHKNHKCERWDNPLWKQRGYNSVEEHDRKNIENWNSKASSYTIGVLLGDNLFGSGGKSAFDDLINSLTFKWLYAMPGNHYSGWWQAFESAEQNILQYGEKTVIFLPNYAEFIVNGQSVVCSHYPHISWNGQGGGSYMLYSHVHGNLDKSELGRLYVKTGRNMEVSVEKYPSPVNFKEIRGFMSNREVTSPDHHDKSTQNPF